MNLFLFLHLFITIPLITGLTKFRLSTSVKPTVYTIKLHPNLDEQTFKGQVSIRIKVQTLLQDLEFHSSNLTISQIFLNGEKAQFELLSQYELIRVTTKHLIPPGNHIIHINYFGKFSEGHRGIFKTSFSENNETLSDLVVTDFEPTFARLAFPCFDEPGFKAKFQLNLITPNSSYNALSNMRAITNLSTSDGILYKFETTRPMSTYLLAFAICHYSYGEIENNITKIPIRVYSYNASNEINKNALQYAEKALEFYAEYTSFPYPLPKIDIIEYDREEHVATENWGLITIAKGFLTSQSLYDDYQKVNVIAHELAHFWFGNLVTNNWWDDIWLQEGLATFMALKVEEYILNNNGTKLFTSQNLEEVFWYDQNKNSKPIVNFVTTPAEIRDNFNEITYQKGAALLLMIELLLGQDKFKTVIFYYICRYAYKTATSNDFINLVEASNSSESVYFRGFIESYLYQNRYPIIQVAEDSENYILKLLHNQVDDKIGRFVYKWTIPITYTTNINKNWHLRVWFDRDMDELIIPKTEETWIKFNYKQVGIYRMTYDVSLWDKYIEFIEELDLYERNHLLLEAVSLWESHVISCEIALNYFRRIADFPESQLISSDTLFIVYTKLSQIKSYDIEASELLLNYFKNVLITIGKKSLAKSLHKVHLNKHAKNQELESQRVIMEECAAWIKKNLRQ